MMNLAALRRFRHAHHIAIIAVLTATALVCFGSETVARCRAQQPSIRVVVNVPAARLDLWSGTEPVRSFTISPGAPAFPTPLGSFKITEITWNPWWRPPPSDWAKDEKVTPPGPNNPMGRVKIGFGPLLFVHGTIDTLRLGRAASHGCIRVANRDAVTLARLLQSQAGPAWPDSVYDVLNENPGSTRGIALENPVTLDIVYQRLEVRDSLVLLHPDPYRRGAVPEANAIALIGAALDHAPLDTVRLRRLLTTHVTRTRTLQLDSLRHH